MGIDDLIKVAKYRHKLDKAESRQRTFLIRQLRGLYSQVRYLGDADAIKVASALVDAALSRLGAEPEAVRRERWHDVKLADYSLEQLVAIDQEEGHKLYQEWLEQK